MPPTMTKSRRPMPRPPCPVLVQGMVNLSSTTYKYKAVTKREEGGWRKGEKRKPGGKILEKEGRTKNRWREFV